MSYRHPALDRIDRTVGLFSWDPEKTAPTGLAEMTATAERCGFTSIFYPEAYGREAMTNGALSTAQLHNGAREDASRILNESMTLDQIRNIVPVMLQEISNGRAASHDVLNGLKGSMAGLVTPQPTNPAGQPTPKVAIPNIDHNAIDAELAKRGHK